MDFTVGNFDDYSDSDEWDNDHIDDHSGTYTGTTTTDDITGTQQALVVEEVEEQETVLQTPERV